MAKHELNPKQNEFQSEEDVRLAVRRRALAVSLASLAVFSLSSDFRQQAVETVQFMPVVLKDVSSYLLEPAGSCLRMGIDNNLGVEGGYTVGDCADVWGRAWSSEQAAANQYAAGSVPPIAHI